MGKMRPIAVKKNLLQFDCTQKLIFKEFEVKKVMNAPHFTQPISSTKRNAINF